MRPKAVTAKNAAGQLGMFWEKMAILSPLFMPKLDSRLESLRQVSLKPA